MPYTGKPPRHNGKVKNQNNSVPQHPYNAGLNFLSSQDLSNSGQLQVNRKYINNMGSVNEVSVVQYRRTTNMHIKNPNLEMNHFHNLRHHQQAFVYKPPHYHNHMNPNMQQQKFPVNHPMQRKLFKDPTRLAVPLQLAHKNAPFINGKRCRGELQNQQDTHKISNKYMKPRIKSSAANDMETHEQTKNLQKEEKANGHSNLITEKLEVPEKADKAIKHADDDKVNKQTADEEEKEEQKIEQILNINSEQPIADQDQDATTKSTKIAREKTPMCLINDLARFNKISFQYRLTNENGPAHCKRFTVTLMLGDEEYTAEGLKIKEAQHLAAKEAIEKTKYKHPAPKVNRRPDDDAVKPNITPTVELNALAMKLGQQTCYMDPQPIENNADYGSTKQQFDTSQQALVPQKPTDTVEDILRNGRKIQTVTQRRQNLSSRYPNRFSAFQHMSINGCVTPTGYTFYSPEIPSKIKLIVGTKQFVGVGKTLQLAKHDAASNALKVLKQQMEKEQLEVQNEITQKNDNKSPISLVFEIGIKRNLPVDFKVLREEGPPHMRTFVTACIVSDIVTEGEGTGKKISKKKAALKMLEELKKLPPLTPVASPVKRTKPKAASKRHGEQPIDVKAAENTDAEKLSSHRSKKITEETEETNSIGKLIEWHQNKKEKEPEFKLVNELGKENARRKQFVVEVSSNNIVVRGVGISKRLAKQDAAQKFLNAVTEPSDQPTATGVATSVNEPPTGGIVVKKSKAEGFSKMTNSRPFTKQDAAAKKVLVKETKTKQLSSSLTKENEHHKESVGGEIKNSLNLSEENCSNLLPTKESSQTQETNETATILTSPNSTAVSSSPKETATTTNSNKSLNLHMKDQLLYLAKLLGFEVEFSDYPKGNHNEFLTIVMLSTTPPQICHGVGVNAIESQEDAAKNALKILSEMGLNNAIKS